MVFPDPTVPNLCLYMSCSLTTLPMFRLSSWHGEDTLPTPVCVPHRPFYLCALTCWREEPDHSPYRHLTCVFWDSLPTAP